MKDPILAARPPMGWNSWDCYGEAATEADVLAASADLADRWAAAGWDTVVIDAGWSMRLNTWGKGFAKEVHAIDPHGRPLPDPGRFPRGFKALADDLHARGQKFGIHALRGVPRLAVKAKLPVLGTDATTHHIADPTSTCVWSDRMFGLRTDHPAAQAYVDSLFALYAEWGVDYLKLDDIASPYHAAEVEMASRAAAKCGRPITLSLSPGDRSPTEHVEHLKQHAHVWRISADLWDRWSDLARSFDLLAAWNPHAGPGGWPDADMLPLGDLCQKWYQEAPRASRLTPDETQTMAVLWCIARSPLMLGGVPASVPPETHRLLTHPTLIALNQRGENAAETARDRTLVVWSATLDGHLYRAFFNLGDAPVHVEPSSRWVDVLDPNPSPFIPPHGSRLRKSQNP